jgi:hypothetical protein
VNTDNRKSRGHGEKKTRKIDAFVDALLANSSVEAASESIGVSHSTGYRWQRDPEVIQRLAEAAAAHRGAWHRTIARLQAAGPEAVETLQRNMQAAESGAAQIAAAKAILDMSFKAAEVAGFEQRLAALEQIAKSGWKGPGNDREAQAPTRTVGGVNGAP